MATNTNNGSRKGAVKGKSQVLNTKTGLYVKRDSSTGQFAQVKKDGTPFKGVTKEQGVTKQEVKKMAPVLKKLSNYDKGKK